MAENEAIKFIRQNETSAENQTPPKGDLKKQSSLIKQNDEKTPITPKKKNLFSRLFK